MNKNIGAKQTKILVQNKQKDRSMINKKIGARQKRYVQDKQKDRWKTNKVVVCFMILMSHTVPCRISIIHHVKWFKIILKPSSQNVTKHTSGRKMSNAVYVE